VWLKGRHRPGDGHDGATTIAEAGRQPAGGAARIEPLSRADVPSAVEFAARVLWVRPGDRGAQFASDITDDSRQMFVAKANGQVMAYGRVAEMAAGKAGPGTPVGCYLSGVLVDPACGAGGSPRR
jgi:hypothetical protein